MRVRLEYEFDVAVRTAAPDHETGGIGRYTGTPVGIAAVLIGRLIRLGYKVDDHAPGVAWGNGEQALSLLRSAVPCREQLCGRARREGLLEAGNGRAERSGVCRARGQVDAAATSLRCIRDRCRRSGRGVGCSGGRHRRRDCAERDECCGRGGEYLFNP